MNGSRHRFCGRSASNRPCQALAGYGENKLDTGDRKCDFELALLEMLEARNDGDQQVTVGEIITADEIEDLAAIFKLVVTVDGGVRDALQ
jgi:hypothetical protein